VVWSGGDLRGAGRALRCAVDVAARLAAVEPHHPAVPKDAFGALRLPLLPVPKVPPK
jgi:hypothetical protein